MTNINLVKNPYEKPLFNDQIKILSNEKTFAGDELLNNKSDASVKVDISNENVFNYLNNKAKEQSNFNSNAQKLLETILSGNTEALDFLSGKDAWNSNLKDIGYEGKAISELSQNEAKDLLKEDGFFSVNETSKRVSSFVISLSGDDVAALQESRKGIVQGFKEAEKMWGGELPEISYKTQEITLEIIDKRIAKLIDDTKETLG